MFTSHQQIDQYFQNQNEEALSVEVLMLKTDNWIEREILNGFLVLTIGE